MALVKQNTSNFLLVNTLEGRVFDGMLQNLVRMFIITKGWMLLKFRYIGKYLTSIMALVLQNASNFLLVNTLEGRVVDQVYILFLKDKLYHDFG